MKFIHYLEKTTGVDIYGIAAFLIFFSFFIAAVIWAIKADKKMMDEMNQLPLK
ncbi:MAG: CcoQ/FixQ family Cbb3-type cytochrome c oxidase assembly chaperone [Sphingobacteriia bacterium]|nr:CcoQ/FixQ family Cbb3-type cytochrome c oxidase assembly chaperone [Sphingobacteriia bacterium]